MSIAALVIGFAATCTFVFAGDAAFVMGFGATDDFLSNVFEDVAVDSVCAGSAVLRTPEPFVASFSSAFATEADEDAFDTLAVVTEALVVLPADLVATRGSVDFVPDFVPDFVLDFTVDFAAAGFAAAAVDFTAVDFAVGADFAVGLVTGLIAALFAVFFVVDPVAVLVLGFAATLATGLAAGLAAGLVAAAALTLADFTGAAVVDLVAGAFFAAGRFAARFFAAELLATGFGATLAFAVDLATVLGAAFFATAPVDAADFLVGAALGIGNPSSANERPVTVDDGVRQKQGSVIKRDRCSRLSARRIAVVRQHEPRPKRRPMISEPNKQAGPGH